MEIQLLFINFLMFLPLYLVSCTHQLISLDLERPINFRKPIHRSEVIALDKSRHARLFNPSSNFSLSGNVDGIGMYITKVKLGTPPKLYTIQVDTGSDDPWVSCGPVCNPCTQSHLTAEMYDPAKSSTAKSLCSKSNTSCDFNTTYVDGSGASSFYIQDRLNIGLRPDDSPATNSRSVSVPFIFGCSTKQQGDLAKRLRAIDGVFGFGPGPKSVISQLASMNITPAVFSHCLHGAGKDGGKLLIGEVPLPEIEYTPLLPNQSNYNVDLRGFRVKNKILQIDPSIFGVTMSIDSGTTLAYFPREAYTILKAAISDSALEFTSTNLTYEGEKCYRIPNCSDCSVNNIMPTINLDFAGNATMLLFPDDYLQNVGYDFRGAAIWCIGFQPNDQNSTILGDLFLRKKIIVYDLVRQQIGWIPYNCSMPFNVPMQYSGTTSTMDHTMILKMLQVSAIALTTHLVT